MVRTTARDLYVPTPLEDDEPRAEADGGAVPIVDDALISFVGRELVSGSEVVDRLLDLRSALIASIALRGLEAPELASR